jgi:hypothetical protein
MALQKRVGFAEVVLATILTATLVGTYLWAANKGNYHVAEALTTAVLCFFVGLALWANATRKNPNASLPYKVGVTLAGIGAWLGGFLLLQWMRERRLSPRRQARRMPW